MTALVYVDVVRAEPITRAEWAQDHPGSDVDDENAAYRKYLDGFQAWRWLAKSGDNHEVLAVSSERYFNRGDCLHAVELLFGNGSHVYRREAEHGNVLLRYADGKAAEVLNIADDGTATIRPEPSS
ncbi:hypothetical protein [Mycobacterium sp. 48b]|uniref:hypothetical protein n=1 Tax=Mycobacterium sp. 48b TaxID=3400426 RepID=UPI003AAC864F